MTVNDFHLGLAHLETDLGRKRTRQAVLPHEREITAQMWRNGMTAREIASHLGRKPNTIAAILRQQGIGREGGRRRGGLSAQFEAFTHPEPNSGCWLWGGSVDRRGYGQMRVTGKTLRYASHVALELDGRPVPKGMCACHHCDNPACVNPAHLFVGTPKENTRDMMRKGRHVPPPRTCKLTPDDVRAIRLRLASGEAGTRIAAAFGVGHPSIYAIKAGRTWREVA
jgi:transposase-like protein